MDFQLFSQVFLSKTKQHCNKLNDTFTWFCTDWNDCDLACKVSDSVESFRLESFLMQFSNELVDFQVQIGLNSWSLLFEAFHKGSAFMDIPSKDSVNLICYNDKWSLIHFQNIDCLIGLRLETFVYVNN